jgi:tubulin-specific chaperone A
MADPRIRQITIKTGVVKRLTKEKIVYEREAENQRNRIEKLKADNGDEHMIRKQEEVLQESLMMVPDCQRRWVASRFRPFCDLDHNPKKPVHHFYRLAKAYEDLKNYLTNEKELEENAAFANANTILNDAKLQLPESYQ